MATRMAVLGAAAAISAVGAWAGAQTATGAEATAALDRAWSDATDALIARMGVDPGAEAAFAALQEAQQAWVRHRDAECAGRAALDGPAAGEACSADLTAARAAQLRRDWID